MEPGSVTSGKPGGEGDGGGPAPQERPHRALSSERIEEFLSAFHRLTGLRFRVVVEWGGAETTLHDSLGDMRSAEYTESSWLVMPEVRVRLALPRTSDDREALWTDLLRESTSRLVASEKEARFFSAELADRYEEIDLLTSVGEILGSVIHLERAAARLVERLVRVIRADRAEIWVPDGNGRLRLLAQGGPEARIGEDGPPADEVKWIERALRAQVGQVRPRRGHAREAAERTLLAVPLKHSALHGDSLAVGVLVVRGAENRDTFAQSELNLTATIGSHLAAAIENDRLARESLEQERMLVELELAHHLQMKLLPELEDFAGIADVAARCEPAESVGGDFYHLFRLPGDRLGVMLGDVSSHGYSAGLIMALTMSAASLTVRDREEPAEVLRGIHHELVRKLESTEMYMTLCYAVLDPGRGTLRYANAGHPHAFRVGPTGVLRLEALNPPLGIAEFDTYAQREVEWVSGVDLLLMFTDGISECLDSDRLWSDEKLTRMAQERSAAGAGEVLDRVFQLAAAPGGVAADDRTALVVK